MQCGAKCRQRLCFWTTALLLSFFVARAFGQDNGTGDNPPSRVARISYLKGKVSFLRAGLDQWSQAALNYPVTTGDRIYTDQGGRAELEVGPYVVRLSQETDLTVTNLNEQIMQLALEQGTVRLSVFQLRSGDTVELDTPNGALTVQEAGKYRVEVDPNGDHTLAVVNGGSLEISGGSVSQTLGAGEAARLTGQDPVEVESVPIPDRDSFDEWSDERDRRVKSSDSAKYVNPFTPGYWDLDDYGHWVVVAEYGPIWYPAVPAGWVPYRFGHWIWVDPWGWTWIEDEVWGFCPFHFGRWVLIGAAWGWLPGPFEVVSVYAPALVAFIGGPGFEIGLDLVAWFPLGPGEPFFPWYHCSGNYLNIVNITNIRNVTNITNITTVTDINNVHYAYRTIATTAVPKSVFSNGQPVAAHTVRLSPQQLAKAQVIPHPAVNPTPRAALPGKPVPVPPAARAQHLAPSSKSAQGPGRSVPASKPHPVPPVAKNTPPTGSHREFALPARAGGTQTSRNDGGEPRTAPPRVITRVPPPAPMPPFQERRPAMSQHPGRPLEPLQLEDLRAERPVRPMRDVEFPPHPAPVIPERTGPPPPVSRPQKPPHQ